MQGLFNGRRLFAAALAANLLAPSALAQRAGDNVIQFGFFSVDTLDRSQPLHTDLRPSPVLTLAGVQTSFDSPGTAATVGSSATLAFTQARFITDHLLLKLEGGIPAIFDIFGRGTVRPTGLGGLLASVRLDDPAYNNPLGSARQWSPVLLTQYYFFGPEAVVRPFLGVGVTYTFFTDVRLNGGFQQALNDNFGSILALAAGKPGPTHTTVNAGDNWSPVYSGGIAWRLSSHWGVSTGISFAPLNTYATIKIRAQDDTVLSSSRTKIDLNSTVYSLLANYSFRF